jgi:hypothetical protein
MSDGNKVLTVIGAIVLIIGIPIALHFLGVFGGGSVQRFTADFRGGTDQIEKTHADANYRIAAYEDFYKQYAAIQADEQRIKNLKEELETTNPSVSRIEQINTSITAVRNSRAEKITEYNAKARMADTRANFLASDLPYEIPLD